jgi:hypothetical protein
MNCIADKESEFVECSENPAAMFSAQKTELGLPGDKITGIQTPHTDVKDLRYSEFATKKPVREEAVFRGPSGIRHGEKR